MHSSVYHSFGFFSSVPTESRWLKVIRRSPRARCLPMPSLCRRAVRSIRKRTQRFQSTLQSFPRSAQRGGRYLNLTLWSHKLLTVSARMTCVSVWMRREPVLFWSVCCCWQAVLAIGQVLLKPVVILNIVALWVCPFRCWPLFINHEQCPSAATSFQLCVQRRTLTVLVSFLWLPCCWVCPWWLWFPVQDLRPQGGPVRKQTNSETPMSSWYVLACLHKVCQLLNSWVITSLASHVLVF